MARGERTFVDTNVFIYAFDTRDRDKQRTALHIIERSAADFVISKCTRLVTEDLNAGEVIAGVEIVNPFR